MSGLESLFSQRFYYREDPAQVFFSEFWKISKYAFYTAWCKIGIRILGPRTLGPPSKFKSGTPNPPKV